MGEPPEHPTAAHFILDVIDAFPGRLRTGTVGHPEEDAGDELDYEGKGQRAAPDITPARAARDIFIERVVDNTPAAGPLFRPVEKSFDHATGIFSARPASKFWNFTQTSLLFRIST